MGRLRVVGILVCIIFAHAASMSLTSAKGLTGKVKA
jgi:hypothetical protein